MNVVAQAFTVDSPKYPKFWTKWVSNIGKKTHTYMLYEVGSGKQISV